MGHYKYDVFISYGHLDNEISEQVHKGWVSLFHEQLQIRLARYLGRRAEIWRDNLMAKSTTDFEKEIRDALTISATMVIVTSPSFIEREWFTKEVAIFNEVTKGHGGMSIDDRSRIFVVYKSKTSYEKLQDPLNKVTGYTFFLKEDQTLQIDSIDFVDGITKLAADIEAMLKRL